MNADAELMRVLWDLSWHKGSVLLTVEGGHVPGRLTVMVGAHSFDAMDTAALLARLAPWAEALRADPDALPIGA